MGSFSIWHWLIVLLVVVLVFGTRKLKNIGTDLGGAVKGFKDAVKEEQNKPTELPRQADSGTTSGSGNTIDVEVKDKQQG